MTSWEQLKIQKVTGFLKEAAAAGRDIPRYIDRQVNGYHEEALALQVVGEYVAAVRADGEATGMPVELMRSARRLLLNRRGEVAPRRATAAFTAIGKSYDDVRQAAEVVVAPMTAAFRETWESTARSMGMLPPPGLQDRSL